MVVKLTLPERANLKHELQLAVADVEKSEKFTVADLELDPKPARVTDYLHEMNCVDDTGERRGRGGQLVLQRSMDPLENGTGICKTCGAGSSGSSGCIIYEAARGSV